MPIELVLPAIASLLSVSYGGWWLCVEEYRMAGLFFFIAVLIPVLIWVG